MRLKLLHKGLLLVSIPLCFEITIFSVLINLQNQAEKEDQHISLNKKINDSVNVILHNLLKIGRVQTTYSIESFNTNSFRKNLNNVFMGLNELDKLTRNEPSLNIDVQACKVAISSAQRDLKDVTQSIKAANSEELPAIIKSSRRQLDNDLNQAFSAGLLSLAEKSLKGTDDARSRRLRERITIVLKYALGLSVLMGIFGATMFGRHLVGRLERLGRNAHRLARAQTLTNPEGGEDEIAQLEKSFHYAADLIAKATRMRQEVTALITNDLKSPLEYIRSFLEKMKGGELGTVDEQGSVLLALSEKESVRMVGLIESVLDLERMRNGTLQIKSTNVDVKAMLTKSADAVQLLADEKSMQLSRDFARGPDETIQGDAFWLGQVLVNILSNAIKFSPTRSTVTISLETSGNELVIRISDMGPGISKEDRELVFERFHRISANSTGIAGSGLGLTISRELIELHNGSIDINSELGAGSTFNIRLPRNKQIAQRSSSGARDGKNFVG